MIELEIGSDGVMRWERVTPPIFWQEAGLYVIADRHLPNGRRQHMVEGHVPAFTEIANADVIGAADVPQAEFSARPSHLSTTTGGKEQAGLCHQI